MKKEKTKPIKFFAPLDFVLGIEEEKEEYTKKGMSFSEMIRFFISEGRKTIKEREKETNEKISVGSR